MTVSGTLRSNLDPFGLHDDARLWDALKRAYLVEDRKPGSIDGTEESFNPNAGNRFSLDSPIEDEGGNLSIGQVRGMLCRAAHQHLANKNDTQRSLVSLARALVKESKILILDEATGKCLDTWQEGTADKGAHECAAAVPSASVDYETDRKIQDTIAVEFRERTILCIARKPGSVLRSWPSSIANLRGPGPVLRADRLRTIIGYDRICVMDAGGIAEFDTPAHLYGRAGGIFRGMCERSTITLEDIRYAAKARAVDDEKRTYVEMPKGPLSEGDEKAGVEVDEVS